MSTVRKWVERESADPVTDRPQAKVQYELLVHSDAHRLDENGGQQEALVHEWYTEKGVGRSHVSLCNLRIYGKLSDARRLHSGKSWHSFFAPTSK